MFYAYDGFHWVGEPRRQYVSFRPGALLAHLNIFVVVFGSGAVLLLRIGKSDSLTPEFQQLAVRTSDHGRKKGREWGQPTRESQKLGSGL